MKSLIKSAGLMLAGISFAAPAAAESFSCSSQIWGVAQSEFGTVYVQTDYGMFGICNLDAAFFTVTAKVCEGWLTDVLTARGLGKPVEFYFDTNHQANANLAMPYCAPSNFNWSYRVPSLVFAHL